MTRKIWLALLLVLAMTLAGGVDPRVWAADSAPATDAAAAAKAALEIENAKPWPPPLPGAGANGTVTLTSPDFLVIPPDVQKELAKPGATQFSMAKTPPTVDLAPHRDLPNRALNGTGWSVWGDICVASDGRVYCGVGDHGDDVGGHGHVYIYQYDPATKTLRQIIDGNNVRPRKPGDITFAKVHAGIQETSEGKIIAICTLGDGGTAGQVKWTDNVPGSQFIEYDPQTGKAEIIGALHHRCTATTKMDRDRDLLYLCLEGHESGPTGGAAALGVFDVVQRKLVYRSPDGVIIANRNIAMDAHGNIYFNGKGGLWKFDAGARTVAPTGTAFPPGTDEPDMAGMRSSSPPTRQGYIYGTTAIGTRFRLDPATNKLDMLGFDFLTGCYTTVMVLSPDEKYLYYLPGAHGGAKDIGTPVVQYEIATGKTKVLAFLQGPFEKQEGIVLAGTYGVKLSRDGSTLYVDFNGNAADSVRPSQMTASGFGFTSFAAIHIPESER